EANRVALVAKAKAAGLTDAQANAYAAANKEASVEAAQTALDGIVAENKRIADKKADLTAKAQTAGLNADRAKAFADSNVNTADGDVAGALTAAVANAVVADKGGNYTGSGLTNDTKVTSQEAGYGQITTPYGTTYTSYTKTEKSVDKTYNQPYSVVVGKGTISTTTDNYSSSNSSTSSTFKIDKVAGLATLDQNIPTTGKAVYTGGAFSAASDNGKLNYLIDFDKRKGSGDIQGLNEFGDIKLKEANLTKVNLNGKSVTGVSGSAQANAAGSYTLGLFGPQADEVAGKATIGQKEIGFAGQKDANATLKKVATDAGLSVTRAQAYADAYVGKDNAADALKAALQTQTDDLAKLVAQGTTIGLTDSHAQTYAKANLDTAEANLKAGLETEAKAQALEMKQTLAKQSGLDNSYASFTDPQYKYIDENTTNSKGQVTVRKGYQSIYSQPYSMVVSTNISKYIKDDIDQSSTSQTFTNLSGFATQDKFIPVEGKAAYIGKAIVGEWSIFNMDLVYNVDFSKRTGVGYLTKGYADNYYGSKITLNEGSISKVDIKGNDVIGISSTAKSLNNLNGSYKIGFYGTEAQEIGGILNMPTANYDYKNQEYGLAGTRGDIIK
ncbi:factor H binding family protein, partial [Moraxella osloensis]